MKKIKLSFSVLGATAGMAVSALVTAQGAANIVERVGPSSLEVLGPVQSVDGAHHTIRVDGQTIAFNANTTVSYDNAVVSGGALTAISSAKPGDLMAAYGNLGRPARSIKFISTEYVPGAAKIFVRGRITALDTSIGQAKINGLTFDYTPAMSNAYFKGLHLGEIVGVSGIQPVLDGVLLADSVQSGATAASIIGSGAQNMSIIGSGAKGASIIGSGATAASIIGSGAQSTSIIGSGAKGASIIGSGAQNMSIIGSGATAASIIGSGAQGTSIIGSGATAASIIGSGAQNMSIIGSGAKGASIIGSGAQNMSIIGSGAKGASIIGSGAKGASIIGSGNLAQ